MSKFSYSLDVGEELAREKEVKRRIAQARGDDEEEAVRLDPKFEQEIQQLAEETTVANDDSIVITPAKVVLPRPSKVIKSEPVKKQEPVKKADAPKPVAPKTEQPKKSEPVKKAVAPKHSAPKAEPVKKAVAPKVESKAPAKKVEPKKPLVPKTESSKNAPTQLDVVQPAGPAAPEPVVIQPRTPGDGSGRLVLALLIVSVIAVILIYTGLASKEQQLPSTGYIQFAHDNNLTLVTLSDITGARQYWFGRALQTDSEGESAAEMKMALCDKEPTEQSNPLDFAGCDVSNKAIVVRESDVQLLLNLSEPSTCQSMGEVIVCDNGYIIDGLVASKDGVEPSHLVAKSDGKYTIVDFSGSSDAVAVMSDVNDQYVSYTLPSWGIKSMLMKMFVGDDFSLFERLYLDHNTGSERVVLYRVK